MLQGRAKGCRSSALALNHATPGCSAVAASPFPLNFSSRDAWESAEVSDRGIGDQEPSCDAELKLLRTWARPAPAQLQNSAAHWRENMGQSVGVRSGGPYMLAHSLAHALMTEIALDCGYPATALKERIYALPRLNQSDLRCGLLIYTATAGIQGTLGGLVEVAGRFRHVPTLAPGMAGPTRTEPRGILSPPRPN
jgi:hypothetical protein